MSYFDSPKNRAIWNKEMSILRQERQDRRDGIEPVKVKTDAAPGIVMAAAETSAFREHISYNELLAEEREAVAKTVSDKRTARTLVREKSEPERVKTDELPVPTK